MSKVGCKFDNGIVLQLAPVDGTRRLVRLKSGENDVDPDFWDAWLMLNRDAAIWTDGMIYKIGDF